MTVSSSTASPALAALADNSGASDVQSEASVTMLKKANDQIRQQGEAMVAMIEKAGASAENQFHLDTYA